MTYRKVLPWRRSTTAGVPYVVANAWGTDPTDEQLSEKIGFENRFASFTDQCKSLGNISWIAMACGFWYEFSLGCGSERYGFDFEERSVAFFDDGSTKINTSTFAQCGRAMAAFLSLPMFPEHENDKRPTISRWTNNVFRFSSFLPRQSEGHVREC
ncbi:unnamed protein product [Discula destructiva]